MSQETKTDTPPAPKTGVAALDDLFQAVNRGDAPGLVVGVAQHGKTLYRKGFGLASIEHAVANTPWTRMRIGSTSKHFTCLAALLLAEDGKLDIDASVRRYIPKLPVLLGEPTLRQLMTHSGGHRCYLDIGFLSDGVAIKPQGAGLAAQLRQVAANFAPGDNMIYNNGGYHLLSLIIAQVSGLPFEQFLKERIFTPLGMIDTESVPSDFIIKPGMATLHVPVPPTLGGGWRRGIFPTEEVLGEGAMISTVDDMLRWLAHLRAPEKTVGSADTWKQMLTCVRLNNGHDGPYALGLMRHDYRGVEVIHHAGGVIGGSCQMLTVPSHGLDIIIMVNGGPVNPVEQANKIIDTMLGEALTGAPHAIAQSERFKGALGTRYHAPATGYLIGFSDLEGKLGLSVMNGQAVPVREVGGMLHHGFDEMAAGALDIPAAALAGDGTAPDSLQAREAGAPLTFVKLPATAPKLADAGAGLVGRYRAPDLDADAEIRFDGETLLLRIFGDYGISRMKLEAYSDDVFGWQFDDPSLPLRAVLDVERSGKKVKALRMNTVRSRQIRLERVAD